MNCQQFKEMMDSYISDELLVETNHDVLHHLENCPSCRGELSAQRNLRSQLRSAVRNSSDAQMNPAFAVNLRNQLRETALQPRWWEFSRGNSFFNTKMLLASAMCLLFVAGFGLFWKNYRNASTENISIAQNQPNTTSEPNFSNANLQPSESPVMLAVQAAWREIGEFAVGDHKDCAVKFNLAEKPISLDEAAKKYGKFNKDLDKAVIEPLREAFPEGSAGEIKLLQAHSCIYGGRRFAHVVLRRGGHLVSVLITDTDLPNDGDEKISNQTNADLQIAGFRHKNYAVFVVSGMTEAENSSVANALMPSVEKHIEKYEA